MEKEEITAGPSVSADGVTIIPIVKVSIGCQRVGEGTSLSGFKHPTAVVVVSPSGTKAFDMAGKETSLDELMEEVPELREMLQST